MLLPWVKGLVCDKMMPSDLLSGVGQSIVNPASSKRKKGYAKLSVWCGLIHRSALVFVGKWVLCLFEAVVSSQWAEPQSSSVLWNVLAYSSDSQINLPTCIAGKADKIHNSAVHESVTTAEQTVERTQRRPKQINRDGTRVIKRDRKRRSKRREVKRGQINATYIK